MIISASRRTDIPAFYAEWLINRVREGYLFVQNPFNARQITSVNLSPGKVDAIVFWTRNPGPLMKHLAELHERGYRYYFQFTLTGYPSVLEPSLPNEELVVSAFRELSRRIGPERVVWRFDPVIISDVTTEAVIIETFRRLAGLLSGYTRRVVISFAVFYKSVKRYLDKVEKNTGVRFYDISQDRERMGRLAGVLADIARSHSLEIVSCSTELDLAESGISHGKCIDDELIGKVLGNVVAAAKDPYQRKDCLCVRSQDIGQYNTCTHDCVYCYAGSNKNLTHRNQTIHDPTSPFLIGSGPEEGASDRVQMGLFSGNKGP